jgi:dipeptide/tripeptide permease
LVALYYLATGAIANYLAGRVADLTVDPTTNSATALTYHTAYLQIFWASLFMFLALFIGKSLFRILR